MTGLWQISGRSNLGFDDLVRLDFYYLENWSIWLDISIILRTLPAVFSRKGALLGAPTTARGAGGPLSLFVQPPPSLLGLGALSVAPRPSALSPLYRLASGGFWRGFSRLSFRWASLGYP